VHSFIIATGARTVLETGCFMGGTSVWIMDALWRLTGGDFHMCEIDPERLAATEKRLYSKYPTVSRYAHAGDVLDYLRTTEDRFDLAWVDDEHTKPHVFKELQLLLPKMNEGGLILGHDVWGSCDLQEVFQKFGGYSIDLPRLGPAGGLGIIQVR
jgi:predicted O-methyltransferase YrrM